MKVKKPHQGHITLNLTAMLDVVFNLIFFFICIANMAGNELPQLDAPRPDHSKAINISDRKKVTVNVIPEEGGTGYAKHVKVGADLVPPGEEGRITALLKKEVELNPAIEIDLRVDKTIRYQAVRPVMNSITRAGIARINLVAFAEGD
jgi:biopolymer transport protein ExbD